MTNVCSKTLLREAELAALAERQRETAEAMKVTRRLLPVVNTGDGSASHLSA